MALDRPIVTEASLKEFKKQLDADKASVEKGLAEIDRDYKAWKAKLSAELRTEYNRIRDLYKKYSVTIAGVLRDRKRYRQMKELLASKKKPPTQPLQLLAIPEGGGVDKKHGFSSARELSAKIQPLQEPRSSSARTLASLPNESERVERLQRLHQHVTAEDTKRKGLITNNVVRPPVSLKPLERMGTFFGGPPTKAEGPTKILRPSASEQLLRKGKAPCESQPSSRFQQTKRWG